MKRTLLIVVSLIFVNQHVILAQNNESKIKNNKIGISFSSLGSNDVFRFNELTGAASYDGDNFTGIGIVYVSNLNGWLEAETGIEFIKHHIIIHPNLPPDADNSPRKANFSLINVPLTLRANFLKYFFVNGGLMLDIDASANSPVDSQTGVGSMLGIAIKYDFDFGISAFVNPYTKIHSLLPFADPEYHQRIMENGIRMGLTVDLGKFK